MPKNDLLFTRLEQATNAERKAICDILGLEIKYINDIEKISKELRSVSGHSIVNTFRDAHGLKYIEMLKETYRAILICVNKNPKITYLEKENISKANEYDLENEIEKLIQDFIQQKYKRNSKNISKELSKEIISCGKTCTSSEVIFGGGGVGLMARFISLPVSIGLGTVQALTTPTYRKTFQVIIKLIDIKRRFKAEQKLKD